MTMGYVDPRQYVKKKYRGEVILTAELLSQILTLPEGVSVRAMKITDNNFKQETLSVLLESEHETEVTPEIPEGCMIPNVTLDVVIEEEVKTITTIRKVRV